jgi:DNA-binding transcriptional ArsR family regulator
VGELAALLASSQPGVSKHLRVLREAGLVSVRQEAQRHWYELRLEPLAELDTWLGPYRQLWHARLDRMDAILHEVQANEKGSDHEQ